MVERHRREIDRFHAGDAGQSDRVALTIERVQSRDLNRDVVIPQDGSQHRFIAVTGNFPTCWMVSDHESMSFDIDFEQIAGHRHRRVFGRVGGQVRADRTVDTLIEGDPISSHSKCEAPSLPWVWEHALDLGKKARQVPRTSEKPGHRSPVALTGKAKGVHRKIEGRREE